MRLRLEMDALPRLFDMLLFVFIVRHFFMRLSTIEVLLARWHGRVWRQRRAVRPLAKIRAVGLEIFQPKGKRIALLRTFSITSKQGLLSWYDCIITGAKFPWRWKRMTIYWNWKFLKIWNCLSPESRVCDNPTTQEGGSSLSRPVDSNKRRVA